MIRLSRNTRFRARTASAVVLVSGLCGLPGCVQDSTNPDFPVRAAALAADCERMIAAPVKVQRPIVIICGYRSATVFMGSLQHALRDLTGADDSQVMVYGYPLVGNFPDAVNGLVEAIEKRWPSGMAAETVEVDVVAISMGGLVARAAAVPWTEAQRNEQGWTARRLNVKRLFTLATPHRGANLAKGLGGLIDTASEDMRPGSAFLGALDAALPAAEYELVCYARTRDGMVGATNCAPPGMEPIWLEGPWLLSHLTIHDDTRIIADIARRLRGEEAVAVKGSRPPRD